MRRLYLVPPIILALAKHPLVDQFDLSSLEFILSGAAPLGAELEARLRRAPRLRGGAGLRHDRDEPGVALHADRARAPGLGGPDRAEHRSAASSIPRPAATAPRRGRRALGARAAGDARLPQQARGHGRDAAGRLAQDRRSRPHRRRRLSLHRRPGEGADQGQGLPGAAGRARGAARQPSRRRRRRGDRPARRRGRRGAGGLRRARRRAPTRARRTLQAFVAGHVAHYKQLRRVAFVEAIPKSPSGKILRRVLRPAPSADAAGHSARRASSAAPMVPSSR